MIQVFFLSQTAEKRNGKIFNLLLCQIILTHCLHLILILKSQYEFCPVVFSDGSSLRPITKTLFSSSQVRLLLIFITCNGNCNVSNIWFNIRWFRLLKESCEIQSQVSALNSTPSYSFHYH